jgi:putative hemolysin
MYIVVLTLVTLCALHSTYTNSRYKAVENYALAHGGTIKNVTTTYGGASGWQVVLPDGSVVSEARILNQGDINE